MRIEYTGVVHYESYDATTNTKRDVKSQVFDRPNDAWVFRQDVIMESARRIVADTKNGISYDEARNRHECRSFILERRSPVLF